MTVKSLTSVVNGSFLNRFGNLAQSNSGSRGASAAAVLAAGLQTAARTYGTAVQGLNGVATYLNVSRGVLGKLDALTDQMIDLADKSSRGGIGSQKRANYDRQLKDLASEFTNIVKKTKTGGYNALKLEDIESVFVTMGLDPTKVDSIKKIFSFFQELEDSADKKSLAADTSHAKRPIKIPAGAYSQEVVSTNGTGTFTLTSTYNSGGGGSNENVQIADINGDGHQDVVTGADTGNIAVQLGNGDGTFQATQNYAAGGSASRFNLTQLAGDGLYDAVAVAADGSSISVLLGGAGGTLTAAVQYDTGFFMAGEALKSITTGDFDGDLIADILVGGDSGSYSLLKGNADGTFNTGVVFAGNPASVADLVSGDFDGDGDRDFASYGDGVDIYLNDGTGSFTLDSTLALAAAPTGRLLYSDIDGNGRGDLLVSDSNNGNIKTFTGNPDGTFTSVATIATTSTPAQMAAVDVDNDGVKDLVFANKFNFGVMIGNNDGTFQAPSYVDMVADTGIAIGAADFNGDGVVDVITGENTEYTELFLGDIEYTSTIQENVLGKPREFTDLFDERRHIRKRPEAYQMLADLKALKEQITTNLDAADKVGKFLSDNISLVRAAGFAFLAASSDSRLASITDAEQLAAEVRAKIRSNPGVALSQAGNLEAITVASLVLDSSAFPSLKNYKSILK